MEINQPSMFILSIVHVGAFDTSIAPVKRVIVPAHSSTGSAALVVYVLFHSRMLSALLVSASQHQLCSRLFQEKKYHLQKIVIEAS